MPTQDQTARHLARYVGTDSYRRLGNGDDDARHSFRRDKAALWYLLAAAVFFAIGLSFAFF